MHPVHSLEARILRFASVIDNLIYYVGDIVLGAKLQGLLVNAVTLDVFLSILEYDSASCLRGSEKQDNGLPLASILIKINKLF